jgi:hypothetical protein
MQLQVESVLPNFVANQSVQKRDVSEYFTCTSGEPKATSMTPVIVSLFVAKARADRPGRGFLCVFIFE